MGKPSEDTGKIARSAGTVSFAVMCSRVLGLVREQVFAIMFGAGRDYDAFVVAFRIPNLLRDLFGEGALSSAFVAVFSEYDTNKGSEATWKLANNVIVFLGILLSVITVIGIYFAEPIVLLLAPKFAEVTNKVELTAKLTVIMFPFLIFISLAAVVMGILNAKGRFFVPAMASSFFNLGSIAGGVGLAIVLPKFGQPAIAGMALGTLTGGLLQLIWQLPSLLKTGFTFAPCLNLRDPGLLRIMKLMIPAIIGLSATQVNIFINTYFASSCAEGSVSWLQYAFRLVQFPIGVFGVAISIATLPVVARYAAKKDMLRLKETYSSSLTMAFCLTIPATVGLFVLAEPIIRIIFEHGAFTSFDTVMTAEALAYYSLGLFAYAAVKIMVPVFYALDDTRFPVIASFLAVLTNILVIFFTIDHFQHKAIAISTSCAMTFNFLFLSVVLYRKLSGYDLGYLGVGFAKIAVSSGVMGIWLVILPYLFPAWTGHGILTECVWLLLCIGSGGVIYVLMLHVSGLHEFNMLTGKIMDRFRWGKRK